MKTNNANDCSYTEVKSMQQFMIRYLVTCTSNAPPEEMITKYDPLLLAEINLTLTSMVGGSCSLTVEQMEIVETEEYAE